MSDKSLGFGRKFFIEGLGIQDWISSKVAGNVLGGGDTLGVEIKLGGSIMHKII